MMAALERVGVLPALRLTLLDGAAAPLGKARLAVDACWSRPCRMTQPATEENALKYLGNHVGANAATVRGGGSVR